MAAYLICLRHAEAAPPIWGSSEGATLGAPPDLPLTPRGRQQAEAVAHRLLGARLQQVFVSPTLRSRQTGAIIGAHLGLPVTGIPTLAEASMGRYDLAPSQPGPAAGVLRQWIVVGNLSARLADGETGYAVAQRMAHTLQAIAARCEDRVPIVVGHVASLTVGVSALCHNGPALWGKPLPHATPFVLSHSSAGWQVQWPDSSPHSVYQSDA